MSVHRVLYISAESNQISGGTAVMKRNLSLLNNVPNIFLTEYRASMQSKVQALFSVFLGGNFVFSNKDERRIMEMVKNGQYEFVFTEGTTNGRLIKKLQKAGVVIICFSHNVESILYKERAKATFSIFDFLKYIQVYRNERISCTYATKIVTLNNRDAINLKNYYNRISNYVIPISSHSIIKPFEGTNTYDEEYCLFVGSNFFPNNEGINWFISNVLPHVHCQLWVAGSCCESVKKIPKNLDRKIRLLGVVDDLDPLYRNAKCVIAPIFKGSGMKTKTIEAMSYGKTIIGTNECFEGIEGDFDKIGGLCNTSEEFIRKINDNTVKNNCYTLSLFEEKYSNNAVQYMFDKLFE